MTHQTIDSPSDAERRLQDRMTRTSWQLCQLLTARGMNARMADATSVLATRNGIRLKASVAMSVRPDKASDGDLTRISIAVHVRRLFDVGGTDVALALEPLGSTLKGGKTQDQVADQLCADIDSAPLEPYADAISALAQ